MIVTGVNVGTKFQTFLWIIIYNSKLYLSTHPSIATYINTDVVYFYNGSMFALCGRRILHKHVPWCDPQSVCFCLLNASDQLYSLWCCPLNHGIRKICLIWKTKIKAKNRLKICILFSLMDPLLVYHCKHHIWPAFRKVIPWLLKTQKQSIFKQWIYKCDTFTHKACF